MSMTGGDEEQENKCNITTNHNMIFLPFNRMFKRQITRMIMKCD